MLQYIILVWLLIFRLKTQMFRDVLTITKSYSKPN